MRNLSINQLDTLDETKHFLMMLNSILLGWHKDADEIEIDMIKAACGELYTMSFGHINSLKNITESNDTI
ncbi:hypothetical protein [Campylobacter fetus]|uniref:hypothetical protein n=1 Tax=Campylobacter fetus TaxID=196 RepID=UPI00138E20BB|nr:hypothetical protein [Campylobacter fetus]